MYGEKLDCNHFPGWFYLLGRAWSVRGWCMLSVQVCGLCWCLVPPILQAPPFITPIPSAIWPPYTIHMLELANNCLFVEGFYLSIARTGLWNAHTNPLLSGRIPPLHKWLSACLPAYLSRFQNWNSVWLIRLWWNYWVLVIFTISVQISYPSTTNLLIQVTGLALGNEWCHYNIRSLSRRVSYYVSTNVYWCKLIALDDIVLLWVTNRLQG